MSSRHRFRCGVASIPRGARFLARHPRLWGWALLPWAVQLTTCAVAATTLLNRWHTLYQWTVAHLPQFTIASESWWAVPLRGMAMLVQQLLVVGSTVALLLFVLGLAFLVGQILAGPLLEIYAEKIEHAVAPWTAPARPWWQRAWRAARVECIKALGFLLVPLLLQLLHFIPLIGSVLAILGTALFTTWATGYCFLDYPLMLRDRDWHERWHFARQHAGAIIGLGLPCWIPGLSVLLAPVLLVAAILLFHQLDRSDA